VNSKAITTLYMPITGAVCAAVVGHMSWFALAFLRATVTHPKRWGSRPEELALS
jgi:ABC-type phosphate/phosphonate transport system permease subunit